MKVAVIGAGPIGSIFGGHIAMEGHEVWMVDPQAPIVDGIKKNGLVLHMAQGEGTPVVRKVAPVKATTNADEVGKVDLVIVAVKGFWTRSAVENISKVASPYTAILSCQNGLGNADILDEFFPGQVAYNIVVLGGAPVPGSPGEYTGTLSAGGIHAPGTTKYPEKIGHILEGLEKILEPSDFTFKYLPQKEVDKVLWQKLCLNIVVNSCTAVAECAMDAVYGEESGIELGNHIVDEALQVCNAMGVELTREEVDPYVPIFKREKFPNDTYRHFPSMCVDVINRRRLETDFLNGAVVREGKKLGIPTPYNETMHLLMKLVENTYQDRWAIVKGLDK